MYTVIFAILLLITVAVHHYMWNQNHKIKMETLEALKQQLEKKINEQRTTLGMIKDQQSKIFHELMVPLTLMNNYLNDFTEKHGEDKILNLVKEQIDILYTSIANNLYEPTEKQHASRVAERREMAGLAGDATPPHSSYTLKNNGTEENK